MALNESAPETPAQMLRRLYALRRRNDQVETLLAMLKAQVSRQNHELAEATAKLAQSQGSAGAGRQASPEPPGSSLPAQSE